MQRYTEFGLEARRQMLIKGITMTQIGEELGVSRTYVSEIFKGTRPGEKQKPLIAEMLGMEKEGAK